MFKKIALLEKYNRSTHVKNLLHTLADKHILDDHSVKYIFDLAWPSSDLEPEIVTHLLDSYYNIQLRPDFAFTSLWAATNFLYIHHKIANLSKEELEREDNDLKDTDCIRFMLDETLNKATSSDIKKLCDFIDLMPQKLFRFFASQFLRSHMIYKETKNYYECAGFYKNIEKGYPNLVKALENTFAIAFEENNSVTRNTTTNKLIFNSYNYEKNRNIVDACALKLEELIKSGTANISTPDLKNSYTITMTTDYKIKFAFRYIIYASRNHAVHGKTTSRMNSPNFNTEYYRTSLYLYFLTYQYFSIFMNISKRADSSVIEQAAINMNIKDKSGNLILK